MKLHLPKALAAAVMALFAIPNALAGVTFTETSTLTKGVDYFLSYAKGAIVLTLSDSFTSIADNTTLVVAKAQTSTTENKMSIATKVETVTSGETQTPSVKLQTLWNDSASGRSTSSSAVTDSQRITVHFTGNTSGSYQGTSVYTGATSTETDNRILYDSGLRSTSNLLGSAYTYSVANTDKIASASFLDSSVGIIKNLSGSGDMTRPTASFVIIEGSASKDAPVGNNGINLDFGGKALSFAGHVSMGNLITTDTTQWGQGIYVAKGASLKAQSINCNWNPGTMVINGEIDVNAFRMSTADLTEIKGVGSMSVGSLSTNNGGKINTSLGSFTVTGNAVVGEGTSGASSDALTVSGGVFTVNGTTTVAAGRTLTVSGGNATFTGATTINGSMSISGSGTASFGDLNLSGRFVNTGSLSIKDNAVVTFDDGFLKYCSDGELATGNGFGVFNSVALSDVLGENATIGTGVTWKQGTAEISLGTGNVFTLANEVASATYYINDGANYTANAADSATKIVVNDTVDLGTGTFSNLTDLVVADGKSVTINAASMIRGHKFNNNGGEEAAYNVAFVDLFKDPGFVTNGTGEIVISGNVNYNFQDDAKASLTFTNDHANIRINGKWEFNGWGANTYDVQKNLTVRDAIIINNSQTLKVSTGGVVDAGSITIGHDDTNGAYKGYLVIAGGKVTTGSIFLRKTGGASKLTMTGGILEFDTESTGTSVITSTNVASTVELSGGKLLASESVLIDPKITSNFKVTGPVTMETAESKTMTIGNTLALSGSITTAGKGTLSITNVISGAGSIIKGADTGKLILSGTNTYSGGTTLKGGELEVQSATALGTGNLATGEATTSTVTVTGTDALTITGRINMGANSVLNLSGDVKVKDLIDASFSNTRSSTINILSGTTTAEKSIWLHQDSELNISKGASLVASGFTYSGNNADKAGSISAIGTQEIELVDSDGGSAWGHNTNKVNTLLSDLDVEYSAASESILNANLSNVALSTKEGAGKLTLAREGGVSLNSLTANSDVELSTKTTVTGTTTVAGGSTVTVSGAGSSLQGLSGAGTLSSSTDLSSSDGSAFTGTLKSTGGTLAVTQVGATLAAVKAEGGDINLLNTSSVTVTDMVIGEGQTVGVFTEAGMEGDVSVTTLKVTSSEGSAATLNANLELSTGGTLTLNGTLAMGSTLTLGSGITLSGSLLDSWMDRSNALTLFSGVDGLTVNGASVAAGETNGVKASDVFGDSWSNYSLVMTGGTNNKDYNVQLVQTSDVPEPTTATLSLLALMGLAARRRRKAAK